MRVAAIAAVVSAAVASCGGGRAAAPPSGASSGPVPVADSGSARQAALALEGGASNDAGDASTTTGDPEADRDRDGVPDKEDRCPYMPGPFDRNGCPRMGGGPDHSVRIVQVVSFGRNSTRPTRDSDAAIREVANILKAYPLLNVEVIGHAWSDEADPEKTSIARAAAVVARLVHAGVDRKQLVAKSGGLWTTPYRSLEPQVEFQIPDQEEACKIVRCPE